ncbi:MFS transporter [Peribacillus frigoritolerans]|uniref:MFS transporter n=1 Tax=Peribacillus frigoritolerans TaxID=450367 RepID=UPI00339223F0
MNSLNAKAKKSEITLYSFGGFGSNLLFTLTTSFLMYFYTDVFKISPLAVGTVFLIVRVIDAILDPFLGMLADRTRSRWGTYRPWLMFGSPLLAMMTLLLFTAPDLSPDGKIMYAIAVYVGYSFVSSMVNIPYHALTPIISKDPSQRTVIATSKQLLGALGSLLVSGAALPLVALYGSGQKGWFFTTLAFAVFGIISYWLCARGAKNHDNVKVNTKEAFHSHEGHPPLKEQLKTVFKNGPLFVLLVAGFANMTANIVTSSTAIYYWQYNIGRVDLYSQLFIWGTLLSIPTFLLIPYFVNKFGKKNVFIVSCIITILPLALLLMTPYGNVTQIFILSVLIIVLGPLSGVLPWIMIADCVDYGKWKTGINGSATIHSMMLFTNKLAAAIGGILSGALLGAAGYVAGQQQTAEALSMISYLTFLGPILGYVVVIIAIKFYGITPAISEKMFKEINEREQNNKVV